LYIISLKFLKKLKLKILAPKRVFTRSHPDPEPATTIDNPEKLLRKKNMQRVLGVTVLFIGPLLSQRSWFPFRISSLTYLLNKAFLEQNLTAL
jgi:hypothetical protein